MKRFPKLLNTSIAIIFLFFSNNIIFSQSDLAVAKSQFTIGETLEFHSQVLNEKRTINVYLPTYYEFDSIKTYPVIYLLDGSKDEDFVHIAGLVQFGSFYWIDIIPETIVVGISNVDRKRDFTYPTTIKKDQENFPASGGSEKFISFIENELKNLVSKNYRVNEKSTIIGQSLGGLLATEILFKKPELFDNYIIVSPSIWWDNGSLLDMEPKATESKKSIFVAVGKEGRIMEGDAMALYSKLLKVKKENNRIFFKFLEDKDHGDALHIAAYEAFEKLFSKKNN